MPETTEADPASFLPLSEVAWEILLALAGEERHGYAILLEVERRTRGRLQLLPGSLYRALHRMREQGLLEESDAPDAEDPRRRVFRLTELGRRTASAEARRLAEAARAAGAAGLLAGERTR
jgi:DNA-binding PadR family transcriptional regulator